MESRRRRRLLREQQQLDEDAELVIPKVDPSKHNPIVPPTQELPVKETIHNGSFPTNIRAVNRKDDISVLEDDFSHSVASGSRRGNVVRKPLNDFDSPTKNKYRRQQYPSSPTQPPPLQEDDEEDNDEIGWNRDLDTPMETPNTMNLSNHDSTTAINGRDVSPAVVLGRQRHHAISGIDISPIVKQPITYTELQPHKHPPSPIVPIVPIHHNNNNNNNDTSPTPIPKNDSWTAQEEDDEELLWKEAEEKWKLASQKEEQENKANMISKKQPDSILKTSFRYQENSTPTMKEKKHLDTDDTDEATTTTTTEQEDTQKDVTTTKTQPCDDTYTTDNDSLLNVMNSITNVMTNGTDKGKTTTNKNNVNKKTDHLKDTMGMESKMITIKPKKHHHHNYKLTQHAINLVELEQSVQDDESLLTQELQPWSARDASQKKKSDPKTKKESGKSRGSIVVFDDNDTVHEFEPDSPQSKNRKKKSPRRKSWPNEDSDESSYDTMTLDSDGHSEYSYDDTYAGHSMSSQYTKSYESEAEDMVKDFFFIGNGEATNPGRRKLKYRYTRREQYKREQKEKANQKEKEETEKDNDQIPTEQIVIDKTKKSKSSSKENKNNDAASPKEEEEEEKLDIPKPTDSLYPLQCVWEVMEDVKLALGLSPTNADEDESVTINTTEEDHPTKSVPEPVVKEKEESFVSEKQDTSVEESTSPKTDLKQSFLMEYASSLISNSPSLTDCTASQTDLYSVGTLEHEDDDDDDELKDDNNVEKSSSPNDGNGLYQAALCAAENIHFVKRVSFNRDVDIDVVKEIKFIMVTVSLPVGILFQENPAGCWIARLDKNGNASKLPKYTRLEEGDQLAAINGINAINQNVTSISAMLSKSPGHHQVDLTFLRYVGKLQGALNYSRSSSHDDSMETTVTSPPQSPSQDTLSSSSRPSSPVQKLAHKLRPTPSKNKDMMNTSTSEISQDNSVLSDTSKPKSKKKFSLFKKSKKKQQKEI